MVVLLDPSMFIGTEMEGGNLRLYMKRKRQHSRIAFCMNLAQLFILSYLATPWMMFPFKNSRALFCFSSTTDEHTDTVHLIEGFFLMKQWHIRQWEENNRLINVKWALIRRKKQEKFKTQGRGASYKFKSKLVVIRRNIRHCTGTVL